MPNIIINITLTLPDLHNKGITITDTSRASFKRSSMPKLGR